MKNQRYTLSLPSEIYDSLRDHAEKHGTSIREVVRQCLKFGLIGIEISENPNLELYMKEQSTDSASEIVQETRLQFIW